MASVVKTSVVANAAAEKSLALTPISEVKTAILSNASPIVAQAPIPAPGATPINLPNVVNPTRTLPDPRNYRDIVEYARANDGNVPVEVSNFYNVQQIRNAQQNWAVHTAAQEEREAGSWARDNELGTAEGRVKQGLSGLAIGLNRIAQHVAGFPVTAVGTAQQAEVSDRANELYRKEQEYQAKDTDLKEQSKELEKNRATGKISNADYFEAKLKLELNRNTLTPLTNEEANYLDSPDEAPRGGRTQSTRDPGATRRQQIERAKATFEVGEKLREQFEGNGVNELRNPLNRDAFTADLSQTYADNKVYFEQAGEAADSGDYGSAVWNTTVGVVKLAKEGLGDAINNPDATFEFIAENIPQLAAGAVSMKILAATNIAYSVDIYSQAINDYQENNNGSLPSQNDAAAMLAFSLSAAAAEQFGDAKILASFRRGSGRMSRAASETTSRINNAITNNAITRTAGATAKGAVTEGLTETYQTAVEENFSKLDTDLNGEEIFQGGIIGAASGGVLSGAGNTVSEVTTGARNNLKAKAEGDARREATRQRLQQAAKTGDVAALLDPESPDYSPNEAALALAGRIVQPDIELSPEETAATQAQFDAIVADTEAAIDTEQAALEALFADIEETGGEGRLAEVEAQEAKLERAFELSRAVKKTRAFLNSTQETGPAKSIGELLEAAEVAEVISLTMTDGSTITEEDVGQINRYLETTLDIPPEQATYLRNFSDMHASLNAAKGTQGVNQEVLFGGDSFKGITEYQADIDSAIKENNIPKAEKELTGLREFYAGHKARLDALNEANNVARDTNEKVYVVKDPEAPTGYRVETKKPEGWNRQANGGLEAFPNFFTNNPKAQDLHASLEMEVEALKTAGTQLAGAISLAKNPPAPAAADATPVAEAETVAPSTTEVTEQADSVVEPVQENEQTETVNEEPTVPVADATEEGVFRPLRGKQRYEITFDIGGTAHTVTVSGEFTLFGEVFAAHKNPVGQDKWGVTHVNTGKRVNDSNFSTTMRVAVESALTRLKNAGEARIKEAIASATPIPATEAKEIQESAPKSEAPVADAAPAEVSEEVPAEVDLAEQIARLEAANTQSAEEETAPVNEEVAEEATPTEEAEAPRENGKIVNLDTSQKVDGNMTTEEYYSPDTNHLSAYTYQAKDKDDSVTKNALMDIYNFMSSIFDGVNYNLKAVEEYYKKPLEDEHTELLALFNETQINWGETIREIVDEAQQDYQAKQDKRNKEGKPALAYKGENLLIDLHSMLDENVVTAIALSAFAYVGSKSSGNGFNTPKQINNILKALGMDIDKDTRPNAEYLAKYKDVGEFENFVAKSLGRDIAAVLNWKAYADAPQDTQSNLEVALGTVALQLLLKEGLVETVAVKRPKFNQEVDAEGNIEDSGYASSSVQDKGPTVTESGILPALSETPAADETVNKYVITEFDDVFVRVVRDEERLLPDTTFMINNALKTTKNFLSDLFSTTAAGRDPESEPGKFNQKTLKGGTEVPSKQAETQLKKSREGWKAKEDVNQVIDRLDPKRETELFLMGYVDTKDTLIPKGILDSVESRNNGIKAGIENFKNYIATKGSEAFYMIGDIWVHQRTG